MKSLKALFFITLGFAVLLRACKTDVAARAPKTVGLCSWYGAAFKGKTMSNGQPFDPQAFTCASWEYPLGTKLWVQNVANGKTVAVVCSDRGPAKRLHRLVDLSQAAFSSIASLELGVIQVRVIHAY